MKQSIILAEYQIKAIQNDNLSAICVPMDKDIINRCDIEVDGSIISYQDEYGNHVDVITQAPYALNKPLYVRETWKVQAAHRFESDVRIEFKTGGDMKKIQFAHGSSQSIDRCEYDAFIEKHFRSSGWESPATMPKAAARYTLTPIMITAMRVQDVTNDMARKLGIDGKCLCSSSGCDGSLSTVVRDFSVERFGTLLDAQYAKRGFGWDSNPWVWFMDVKVERRNKTNG